MNRNLVKKQMKQYSVDELKQWREHAVKCLKYFLKYPNEFEIEECRFVISHIDQRLKELGDKNFAHHHEEIDRN